MGASALAPRRLAAILLAPVARLHDRALYRIWCDPDKGILGRCHADPFQLHGLGNLPVCAACKRPLRKHD